MRSLKIKSKGIRTDRRRGAPNRLLACCPGAEHGQLGRSASCILTSGLLSSETALDKRLGDGFHLAAELALTIRNPRDFLAARFKRARQSSWRRLSSDSAASPCWAIQCRAPPDRRSRRWTQRRALELVHRFHGHGENIGVAALDHLDVRHQTHVQAESS